MNTDTDYIDHIDPIDLTYITRLFEDLYKTNKYLVKISNSIDNEWTFYMFKNSHIQMDIQTSFSLNSFKVDTDKIVEKIAALDKGGEVKIMYVCYFDDFENYKKLMQNILNNIQTYYTERGRTIHIKFKFRYE